MSFSLVASAKANGASGGTTSAIDTTGAKLLVIEAGFSGAVTISDSNGNTWTAGTLYNATTPNVQFFYCVNPVVGAGHTFTIAASVGSIVVSAWNATNTPSLDSQSVAGAVTGTQSRIGNASFTPVSDGCLVIGGASFPNPGFTSGFAAGTGWTLIDVNNYVSGTSFGSSQVYKVQSTATAIPTTEKPASWTGSTAVSFHGIAFKEAASASLTITTPKAFEVHQRSGATGSIQISGTVAGAAEDIEASFNGGAYQTIGTAVAAGNFSGTLTGQAQGQGTLTVRKKVTTAASATVANVGIGDVFLFGGDSRANGRGTNAQVYTHATLKAAKFSGGVWAELTESASGGTIAPLLATQMMASQSVPVAFIYTGVGSTDVAGVNNTWAKPGTEYTNAVAAVTSSTASVKAALFLLGPNAIYNGGSAAISLATYRAALDTLASNLAADVSGAPKLFVDVCGEMTSATPPDPRTAKDNIRGAVLSAWNNNSTAIKPGPVLVEQDYADNVHPKTDAELLLQANRYWASISEVLYGGSSGRGPRVSTASWNAGRDQLTVTFDRALRTGLTHGTAAWKVSDNGSAMTVSGIAYHGTNPNALVLTTSAAAVGAAGTTTVSFASGDDAVGTVIPTSAAVTLPVGGPVYLATEPIYARAVSELDLTSPTLTSPTAVATGATTATASVSTNEASGTLYRLVSTSDTALLAAVKAGVSSTVTASGTQSASLTGLTASTTYYVHFCHTDLAGNDSAVVTTPSFTTSAAAPPPAPAPAGSARVVLLQNGQLALLLP